MGNYPIAGATRSLFTEFDQILDCLLFILCIAPVGRALSFDRLREVRAAKRKNVKNRPPLYSSPWTGACIRLMQVQMAVLFLFSATNKLKGSDWWNGEAIWYVFAAEESYYRPFLAILAHNFWLVNMLTYATLLFELAFPFLIWQRATRPYMLAGAIFLHLNIGIFMGMPYFSFVMAMGHMSFLRQGWLRRLGLAWKEKIGGMEMIYDGRCGFCVRSMIWLLAFDGLAQITVRNFRTNPSRVVSNAKIEKALHLVLPDGQARPGFEAYRYVVLRVPGLWWLIPFFYLPGLSRFFGVPIYNWIASNRSTVSDWI